MFPKLTDSPRNILFLRPVRLPVGGGRRSGRVGPHAITVFWIGFGRRPRLPGAALGERLRSGAFTDVVDIGIAGALDPRLKRGDLVLSTMDLPFDSREPLDLRRRPELRLVAEALAQQRGVSLSEAGILTHAKPVLSRRDRLAWFEQTGCAAVQMEHAWGVRLLHQLVPDAVFHGLCFTHLVMISDAVPAGDGRLQEMFSAVQALAAYTVQRGIRQLRMEFLRGWLAP